MLNIMENLKEKSTQIAVAKINNVEIVVIENGEKRVAVKPICEILGVDFSAQLQRIKNDEILGSVVGLSTTTGADGKQYEMQTIPFKFVFGWLFTINPKNVAPEAKEPVIRFKLECYDALYNHFTRFAEFVQQKQKLIEEQLVIVEEAKNNFKSAKSVLDDANSRLNVIRKLTVDDYDAEKRQLKMFSDEQMEG